LYKKQNILDEILNYYELTTNNVLFVGFNPWMLTMGSTPFKATQISQQVQDYLTACGCVYSLVDLDNLTPKSIEIAVACDEYFTFAESDDDQKYLVQQLSAATNEIIITTLRDYKNQDFKDKECSQPILISGEFDDRIYLEHYQYDVSDKNAYTGTIYAVITEMQCYGPFARRNMYFKQLAKFSLDNAAENFYVHKNIMYKSTIKKNYEHIITIKF
jgi:hypothetical protein